MQDEKSILQLKYEELIKLFSQSYPQKIKDKEGEELVVEFIGLKKDIQGNGVVLKLGFIPLFQHVSYEADIVKAENRKVVRAFMGSFIPVREIPVDSHSKYQPHQGMKERFKRWKKINPDKKDTSLEEFAEMINYASIEPWQKKLLEQLEYDQSNGIAPTDSAEGTGEAPELEGKTPVVAVETVDTHENNVHRCAGPEDVSGQDHESLGDILSPGNSTEGC